MRKLLILTAMCIQLAGCATVAGIGQDIEGGANTVQGWFN